ncbi:MAG: GNAT family N-acetyltransferase [Crocinitomicaceae bacterium]
MHHLLRLIQESDNAPLSRIIKTSLEELGCALEGTVYTDEGTNHLFDFYQDERTAYYIAEWDGKVVGGSGIAPIPNQTENYCELQRMFLHKAARGKGIGQSLMKKCLDFAAGARYDLVYIETFETMTQARKLYEQSGFQYIDHQLGDTGHFSCGVKMILPLK